MYEQDTILPYSERAELSRYLVFAEFSSCGFALDHEHTHFSRVSMRGGVKGDEGRKMKILLTTERAGKIKSRCSLCALWLILG
jgi:hypothetical protein